MSTIQESNLASRSHLMILFVVIFLLAQCTKINQHVPEKEVEGLQTDGVLSRYHEVLNLPFSRHMLHPGYLVGIEKSPRELIGLNTSFDEVHLTNSTTNSANISDEDLTRQQKVFERTLGDPKAMFVSHILRYGRAQGDQQLKPGLFYSAYSKTAFGKAKKLLGDCHQRCAYQEGWQALQAMEEALLKDIQSASKSKKPYTHIFVAAMGWNNDQLESIERYNAIIEHTKRAAASSGSNFNPIVVGVTWPSVWGGQSVLDLANRTLHIASYPTKADDADEIGYGLLNYVVNAMLPRIEAETRLTSILAGHSMGARMLTRAYFSSSHLKDAVPRKNVGPLVIGLQGAFSANRFRSDFSLSPLVDWVRSAESGPYQNLDAPGGSMVLTWSREDHANPVARFVTGAVHVGGKPGKEVMVDDELGDRVVPLNWEELRASSTTCNRNKILYVDASSIIKTHSDIRNPEVGQLVWRSIECFGR